MQKDAEDTKKEKSKETDAKKRKKKNDKIIIKDEVTGQVRVTRPYLFECWRCDYRILLFNGLVNSRLFYEHIERDNHIRLEDPGPGWDAVIFEVVNSRRRWRDPNTLTLDEMFELSIIFMREARREQTEKDDAILEINTAWLYSCL